MQEVNTFEVFYLGQIDLDKDNEIKQFIENLFKNGFNINAKWSYQESTYNDVKVRWIGWDLDRNLKQEERYRIVLSISNFLNGVLVSQIN
jgi:hypothetical protein